MGKYSTSSSTSHGGKEKFSEGMIISHAKLALPGSLENPDVVGQTFLMVLNCVLLTYLLTTHTIAFPSGSLGTSAAVHDLDQADSLRPYPRTVLDANENDGVKGKNAAALLSHAVNRRSFNRADVSTSPEPSASGISFVEENYVMTSPSSPKISALSTGKTIAREGQSSSSVVTSEASNASSNRSDFSMNLIDEGPVHEDMQDPIDFGQYFEEGYCKASTHDECAELTEAVTDVDSSNSPCEKEKYEEDGDDDDMLGGVFAFSEEGT